jgi:fluoride exporter
VTLGARVVLAVGLGAALGSVARGAASVGLLHLLGPGFPWGTLAVNVLGSFLIGLYAAASESGGRWVAGPVARQFVLSGLCGGFTTFSIFSLEALRLVHDGRLLLAGLHVGGSVVLWLAAVWIGYVLGGRRRGRGEIPGDRA